MITITSYHLYSINIVITITITRNMKIFITVTILALSPMDDSNNHRDNYFNDQE